MDCKYVELVTGKISNRNRIVTIDKVQLSKNRRECYRSLFTFDQDFARFVDRSGSTASYQGPHTTEQLIFDFDNESDLEAVAREVVDFVESAENKFNIPPEYWQIAFSGHKGFHATLPLSVCGSINASIDFSAIYKRVCMEMAKGFKFVDPSIYHVNRVMRMTGSLNNKSNLFKIPVTLTELKTFSADQIKEIARQPRTIAREGQLKIVSISSMESLWQRHSIRSVAPTPTEAQAGSFLAPAMCGERNNRAISICGRLIEQGCNESDAIEILSMWNNQNPVPLAESELRAIVRTAFRRYAKSDVDNTINVFTLGDAEKEYERIVDTPENEKVRYGIPSLDRRIRAFTAGMVCSIVAKSSNGKSAFLQHLLLSHARQSCKPVIFFSLEMSPALVLERIMQHETGYSGKEVETFYQRDREMIRKRSAGIQSQLNNFFLCTKSGITIDEISATVKDVEQKTGHRPSLIGIDYISLMGGKGKDIFERTSANAIAMKQMAKNLEVPIIFLAQTTKAKSASEPLDENAAKDSGSILEASDIQMTFWRSKDTDNDASEWIDFRLRITKNRSGHQGKVIPVRMNKISLRWEESNG